MDRFMPTSDQWVKALAFLGAFCAVIAQAGAFPDEVRYAAAAIAAGCSAVLALSRPPSQVRPPESQPKPEESGRG